MRDPRLITVPIDGQDVRLLVRPLSVAATTAIIALGVPRGPLNSPEPIRAPAGLSIVAAHLDLPPGQVEIDGVPLHTATVFVGLYGGRLDVLYQLRNAVIETTRLSQEERRELTIAVRFLWWLPSAVGDWKETGSSCRKCIEASLCGPRGCDGTSQKPKVVWHDHRLVVNVCPVRSLTPSVEAVLLWFSACYGAQDGRYRRIAFPGPGGAADQDAWLLDAMAHVANVKNELIHEQEREPSARSASDEDDEDGD